VYGVPDPHSGDQVMSAVVLREGADFDGSSFASWLDGQPDLSPKWRPRFVRVSKTLPATPTNKILARTLVHEKFRSDRVAGDPVYLRDRGSAAFSLFSQLEEGVLRDVFESNGRSSAWDL
jgi:fatty-acyl-CoA synthase